MEPGCPGRRRTRVSLLLYLEPVVSVLGALIFLGEPVTLATIAGGLLILAGVAAAGTGLPNLQHKGSHPQA